MYKKLFLTMLALVLIVTAFAVPSRHAVASTPAGLGLNAPADSADNVCAPGNMKKVPFWTWMRCRCRFTWWGQALCPYGGSAVRTPYFGR